MMNQTSQNPDVIVVGSGLGGLSAALHLAKKGLQVLVLEKQPKVGGYCQNYVRGEFDFDVSLHVFSAMNPEGGLHQLLDYMQVLPKLTLTEHNPMFACEFPDRDYQLPSRGHGADDYLKSIFPHEAAGIDRYMNTIQQIVADNTKLFWSGEVDVNNFFPARYFKKTYTDLLNDCVRDPRLHGLFGQLWQSTGLPNNLCAANWAAEVFGSHVLTGNYYLRGGGQSLSNAMAQTLREAGGTVRTGALVSKIIIEDKAAKGVVLESGECIRSNIVIASANPLQTYRTLIGPEFLSKPFQFKLDQLKLSCSLLTIYLGLDCPAHEAGVTDHTRFINFSYDNHSAYSLALDEQYDRTDYMLSDYTDPLAHSHPAGKGIAQILEVADGARWTDISREEYEDKKAKVTETIMTKVARRYPSLSRHIEVMETATPRSMQLYSRNPKGAVYGFAQTPDQADNWRLSVASIFRGLYFAGAWGRGGGGGYMGSIVNGRVAAMQVLSRESISATDIVFPVAPRPATPDSEEISMIKASYTVTIAPADLSDTAELSPQACVRIMSDAASQFVAERKVQLAERWTDFRLDSTWQTSFFQMRFLFVPFIRLSGGDVITVEVEFDEKAPGKGEFNETLLTLDNAKIANASGRVLIRQI